VINISATDLAPPSQLQLMKLRGESRERFGDIGSAEPGG
jgi:hypothetical protein